VEFDTHRVGTVFNATGSGLAKVASERSGMKVVVKPTTGPPAWIYSMNDEGRPEIGIINAFDVWQAYSHQIAPNPIPGDPRKGVRYKAAQKNIRILMMGTHLKVGALVRADSPIKTLNDIKGVKWAWGYPGFPPNIPVGLAVLANAGLTLDDVTPVTVTEVVAGINALMENRVDVAIAAVGMGIVSEADAKVGVRFLPWSEDPKDVKAAQAIMPSGNVTRLAPGPAGVKEETAVWSYPITVVSSTKVADNIAYTLVKTWWDYHQELWPIHRQLKGWAPDNFVQDVATIPFHPGAIKFYKEKGVWGAKQEAMQEQLLRGELPFLK
jgi:hypothetical protein